VRLVRFEGAPGPLWGRWDGETIAVLTGSVAQGFQETGERVGTDTARLLAPVAPTKIVAVGSNYPAHAAEMGKKVPEVPRLFLKPPSAVIGPGAPILVPPMTERVDPEGELAAVIGTRLFRATEDEAMAGVLGYTCLNDVTCRDFQRQDGLFTRAKGFDTFCPVGPWVVTGIDPLDLEIRTVVNGEVRSRGRTSEMFFSQPTLLSFITQIMTLEPGDVVSTGTPPGVAPIHAGDRVAVDIEGIGVLENPVRNREDRAP
jgi:2-keto-4-pentenoate hydratase/2-oxohepta-3-ene-1,7-dioic acid hydratase in catechol pathway